MTDKRYTGPEALAMAQKGKWMRKYLYEPGQYFYWSPEENCFRWDKLSILSADSLSQIEKTDARVYCECEEPFTPELRAGLTLERTQDGISAKVNGETVLQFTDRSSVARLFKELPG